jgi:DNA-binding SARP family transcriptional activator
LNNVHLEKPMLNLDLTTLPHDVSRHTHHGASDILGTEPRPLLLRTFGELQLSTDDAPLSLRGRARDLVIAYLAHGGREAKAASVASRLWPHGETDYALGALNTTLYRLRRRPGLKDFLRLEDGLLRIETRECTVDRHLLDAALEGITALLSLPPNAEHSTIVELMGLVIALYRGPFLEYETGADVDLARQRLRSRLAQVALDAELASHDLGYRAIRWTRQLAAVDPCEELRDATSQVDAARRVHGTRTVPLPGQADRRPNHSQGVRAVV